MTLRAHVHAILTLLPPTSKSVLDTYLPLTSYTSLVKQCKSCLSLTIALVQSALGQS